MFGNRKLRAEIAELIFRVRELEEKLCPCEQHSWKLVRKEWVCLTSVDIDPVFYYKCSCCGKKERTMFPKPEADTI